MEQIKIFPYVEEALELLVVKLYEKEYFGFIQSAKDYVDAIVDFIYTIPQLKQKVPTTHAMGHTTALINTIAKLAGILVLILKGICTTSKP